MTYGDMMRVCRVLAMAAAAAAGYHLLQLLKCFYLGRRFTESACCRKGKALAWTCLLLDKVSLNSSLDLLYYPDLDLLEKGRLSPFLSRQRIFIFPSPIL
jgi:hypothetical protein